MGECAGTFGVGGCRCLLEGHDRMQTIACHISTAATAADQQGNRYATQYKQFSQ